MATDEGYLNAAAKKPGSTLMQQEKAIQRENFLGVYILKLSGFLVAKFHILNPRRLPTVALECCSRQLTA